VVLVALQPLLLAGFGVGDDFYDLSNMSSLQAAKAEAPASLLDRGGGLPGPSRTAALARLERALAARQRTARDRARVEQDQAELTEQLRQRQRERLAGAVRTAVGLQTLVPRSL